MVVAAAATAVLVRGGDGPGPRHGHAMSSAHDAVSTCLWRRVLERLQNEAFTSESSPHARDRQSGFTEGRASPWMPSAVWLASALLHTWALRVNHLAESLKGCISWER